MVSQRGPSSNAFRDQAGKVNVGNGQLYNNWTCGVCSTGSVCAQGSNGKKQVNEHFLSLNFSLRDSRKGEDVISHVLLYIFSRHTLAS